MFVLIKRYKWFLIGLLAFALFIRAVIFVGYLSKNQNFWQVDSNTYHLIADNISKDNCICINQGDPEFYRLPGYPVFLAIFYKLFSTDNKNVLWAQIILAALIPLLIFLLSCALFPQNILLAKLASIYSSIHIGFVLYSGFFMAESLFIFLFLIFAILFLSSVHLFFCPQKQCTCKEVNRWFRYVSLPDPIATSEPYLQLFEHMFESEQQAIIQCNCQEAELIKASSTLLSAGFFLGLASLVRPVGHYLIALSILFLIFSNENLKQKISKSFTLFLGWLIPVSFWLVRNFMLTGQIFFHTLPGGHFLYFSASRIAMHEYNCSYNQAKEILRDKVDKLIKQEEDLRHKKLSEIEECYIRENLAHEYFKKYPKLAIKLWMTDIFRTASSLYSAELLYIESGRQEVDYFNKNRTIKSMISKYIWPQTDKTWLRWLIRLEIFMFLLIILGLLLGFLSTIFKCFKNWDCETNRIDLCSWLRGLAFAALFIVIGLAGGYARMRLPAEAFLIILSMSFWIPMLTKLKDRACAK